MASHNAKRLAIEAVMRDRQQLDADRLQIRRQDIYCRWLQRDFAADVARRLLDMSIPARTELNNVMSLAARSNWFLRSIDMVYLWDEKDQHLIHYGLLKPFGGGPGFRKVRCSLKLDAVIQAANSAGHQLPREARDAAQDLFNFFGRCVPKASLPFSQFFTPLKLLHYNDYVMDKAFVYGIIALSKWLGSARFPLGIFGSWPPEPPAAVQTALDSINVPHAMSASSTSSGHMAAA